MATNDTILLAVKGTVAGQDHIHTLHFRMQGPGSTDAGLATAWNTACGNAYRGMFAAADVPTTLITAAQVCGTLPLRAPAELVPGSQVGTRVAGAGFATSERAPSWLAQLISVRTAAAGKSRRGRFFLGGLYEYDTVGNDLSIVSNTSPPRWDLVDAYLTALTGAFLAGGTNADFDLVIHSKVLAAVPGTQCQDSSTLVTGVIKRLPVASMKSRKPGNGS